MNDSQTELYSSIMRPVEKICKTKILAHTITLWHVDMDHRSLACHTIALRRLNVEHSNLASHTLRV
jgi:hypothetical protein